MGTSVITSAISASPSALPNAWAWTSPTWHGRAPLAWHVQRRSVAPQHRAGCPLSRLVLLSHSPSCHRAHPALRSAFFGPGTVWTPPARAALAAILHLASLPASPRDHCRLRCALCGQTPIATNHVQSTLAPYPPLPPCAAIQPCHGACHATFTPPAPALSPPAQIPKHKFAPRGPQPAPPVLNLAQAPACNGPWPGGGPIAVLPPAATMP